MKADPTRQQQLLELQALDTRLAQLDHQLTRLPEHAELQRLAARTQDVQAEVIRARTAYGDVQRELTKAEADVQLVRDRAARDQARLDAGTANAKDLQALEHEIVSLARRQSTLEDAELEVMERAEALESELGRAERREREVSDETAEVTASRDARTTELASQRAQMAALRAPMVEAVGAELVGLYDKVRAHSGTGAAALVARRCTGCQLEITAVDIGRLRAAAPDEVMRCEECRRILVRTAASGL